MKEYPWKQTYTCRSGPAQRRGDWHANDRVLQVGNSGDWGGTLSWEVVVMGSQLGSDPDNQTWGCQQAGELGSLGLLLHWLCNSSQVNFSKSWPSDFLFLGHPIKCGWMVEIRLSESGMYIRISRGKGQVLVCKTVVPVLILMCACWPFWSLGSPSLTRRVGSFTSRLYPWLQSLSRVSNQSSAPRQRWSMLRGSGFYCSNQERVEGDRSTLNYARTTGLSQKTLPRPIRIITLHSYVIDLDFMVVFEKTIQAL